MMFLMDSYYGEDVDSLLSFVGVAFFEGLEGFALYFMARLGVCLEFDLSWCSSSGLRC